MNKNVPDLEKWVWTWLDSLESVGEEWEERREKWHEKVELEEEEEEHKEDEIVVGCNGWEKTFKVAMFVSLFSLSIYFCNKKVSKGS